MLNTPVPRPPKSRNNFVLYLCVEESTLRAILTQADNSEVEFVVYYLSKKLLPCEKKYKIIKKNCLVMVWAISKLRHCF